MHLRFWIIGTFSENCEWQRSKRDALIFRSLLERARTFEIMTPNRSGSVMVLGNSLRRAVPGISLERSRNFPVPRLFFLFFWLKHFSFIIQTYPDRLSDAKRSGTRLGKHQNSPTSSPPCQTCCQSHKWAQKYYQRRNYRYLYRDDYSIMYHLPILVTFCRSV